ncbi:MAG: hypothetical protein BGO07_02825 [Alphaproteobacteria bacterium 40-19]|nr:MAG: hypothetical protein BGO07_02825 [Alphaproteobacteria bacterium 40-19]
MKKIFIYFVIGLSFSGNVFATGGEEALKAVSSLFDETEKNMTATLEKVKHEAEKIVTEAKKEGSESCAIQSKKIETNVIPESKSSPLTKTKNSMRSSSIKKKTSQSSINSTNSSSDSQNQETPLSPPEKLKIMKEMKNLKEEASVQEIALRKNPSKKFDPKILQQVNAYLLAKVSEAEILYGKKDPNLTDERIRQTLLLAQTAQNLMEGLSNMNDILSGVEEKRSALNMAKNYFSKYDSDEKVYALLQNIDENLKKLDGFDQDNESGENENTFALKNKIEALGHELYGKSMGFDRSDKENKEDLLEKAEEINTNVSANKKLWDKNLSELENLMKTINQQSEEMKNVKIQVKEGNQEKTESERKARNEKVQKNKEKENKELDSVRDAQLIRIWKINNPKSSEQEDQKEKERIEKLTSDKKKEEIESFYAGKKNKSPVKSEKK